MTNATAYIRCSFDIEVHLEINPDAVDIEDYLQDELRIRLADVSYPSHSRVTGVSYDTVCEGSSIQLMSFTEG